MSSCEKTIPLIGQLNPIDVEKVIREIEELIQNHHASSQENLIIVLLFDITQADREAAIALGNYLLYKQANDLLISFLAINIGIVCYNAMPAFMVSNTRAAMRHSIFDLSLDYLSVKHPRQKRFHALLNLHSECLITDIAPTNVPNDPNDLSAEKAIEACIINEII